MKHGRAIVRNIWNYRFHITSRKHRPVPLRNMELARRHFGLALQGNLTVTTLIINLVGRSFKCHSWSGGCCRHQVFEGKLCAITEIWPKRFLFPHIQVKNFPDIVYHRSHAIGLCLVWPVSEDTYEIKHLCSVPTHRNKGVEECLINLALKYCKNKSSCSKVIVKFDEQIIKQY